jgi:hypothetical protein
MGVGVVLEQRQSGIDSAVGNINIIELFLSPNRQRF